MKHQCLWIEYQTLGGIALRSEIGLEVLSRNIDRIWNSVDRTSNPFKQIKYKDWNICRQNFKSI